MNIGWAFQRNEDGSSQGWNDPAIAEFKSNRLESLTRETIQNSLDAKLDDNTPVYVDFVESNIPSDQIPNLDALQEILTLCEKEAKHQNLDTIKELSLAKQTASRPRIPILSVANSNTRGMKGPCEPGEPFYQYLKAVGQSGGSSDRGGSHGIGKAAPLACSDLRTIFVSTIWKEKKHTKSLVQGRAVLMSFTKSDGIYKSTGYWGDADAYQALEPENVPEKYKWLLRPDIGTTVHIVGWNRIVPSNWEKLIIGYAICSFFAAFMRGKLAIHVNKYQVDASNVLAMARNEAISEAMRKDKALDKLEEAVSYMACLSNTEHLIREETQLIHLGRTSIRMLVADDAPRKIALIRNNMLITDTIPGFWKKIPGKYRDFVGVVEVLNPDGSKFIRLMEPPSHNSLSKDWLPTLEERNKGALALDKLSEELKKFVERHAGGGDEVFGKVDFMTEFFADEAGDDRGEKIGEEIDPNGNFIFSPKPIKLAPVTRITLESELEEELEEISTTEAPGGEHVVDSPGGGGGGAGGGGGGQQPHGPEDGPGTGGSGVEPKTDKARDRPSHPIHLRSVRIVKLSDKSARVYATASGDARAVFRIHEVGSDFDEPFEVTNADNGTPADGAVNIDLKDNVRISLTVELSRPIIGGLKLVAGLASEKTGHKP